MNYLKSLFEGRLGRTHFSIATAIVFVLSMGVVYVYISTNIFANIYTGTSIGSYLIVYTVGFIIFVLYTSLAARRLHDLNLNGVFSVVLYVPTIGVLFVIYLALMEPKDVNNRFGQSTSSKSFIDAVFKLNKVV